jgi:E3 SUMO-protein ligase PIAS1
VVECKGASGLESYNDDDIDQEPARENTRDTAKVFVNLTDDVTEQLQQDRNFRVMVFCTADNNLSPFAQSEIAFPHQVELKCNLDEVKANLRGLKNKPGSTRPADITPFIRKKVGYLNEVQMTYALTQKVSGPFLPEFLLGCVESSKQKPLCLQATPTLQKFFLVVNLVHMKSVEELVAKLRIGKVIRKEKVIEESTGPNVFCFLVSTLTLKTVTRRAQDADIVATSTKMSLKCPLSTLRIDTPCRSIGCAHNQCFDAASYLQLQEQAPTWTCPVCNKYSPFEHLAIDL